MNTGLYLSRIWNQSTGFFLVVFSMIMLMTCAGRSQEDLIQETIQNLRIHAEDKDVASIMLYIAEGYQDFRGRDKRAAQDMLQRYFSDYRGIVVHMLGTQISIDDTFKTHFQMEILVSSGGAKIFRKMIKFAGDLYRIQARMVREEGIWKIAYAEWEVIYQTDLFPESFSILKQIFPNL